MSPTAETRANLAQAQADLMASLMAGAPTPAGFSQTQVKLAANSLAQKRARAVARAWPTLERELGATFRAEFSAYARHENLPPAGPLADGRLFARWLAKKESLPENALPALLVFDAAFACCFTIVKRRLWPVVRLGWQKSSRRLLIAIGIPGLGVRLWQTPRLLGTKNRNVTP